MFCLLYSCAPFVNSDIQTLSNVESYVGQPLKINFVIEILVNVNPTFEII